MVRITNSAARIRKFAGSNWAILVCLAEWLAATASVAAPAPQPPKEFQIHPGFRIEVAAASPLVAAPSAMAFDENGRLFVAEMLDYPDKREQTPHLGRIRLLEDTDGDGVFDSGTIYAENLAWPSALACYGGGVFVATTPEILYLKDSNGGSVADTRKVIVTGFGGETNVLSVQRLLNSFVWGPDNRIHGATAGLGGAVITPGSASASLVGMDAGDFSLDPRDSTIALEPGSGQSSLTFDNRGRMFVGDYARPLRLLMFDLRYATRNPYFARPPQFVDVVRPLPAGFKFMPADSRSNGLSRAVGAAGQPTRLANGMTPTRFMYARSALIYRGGAFPTNYLENVFIADPVAHVIYREVLSDDGLQMAGRRAPDDANSEFLASRDPAFQPMQIVAGPDGALYVADLRGATNSGRIYRIVPDNFRSPKPPRLASLKSFELLTPLAEGDGWRRDTARRLFVEQRDPLAPVLLSNMLNRSQLPLARLEALRTLDGLGAVSEALLAKGMRDPDDRVRELAVRLCDKAATNGVITDPLWNQMVSLGTDPSLRVRYQLALTLGLVNRPAKGRILADILGQTPDDVWLRRACLSAIAEGGSGLLLAMAGDSRWQRDSGRLEFVRETAAIVALQGHSEEIEPVLEFVARGNLSALARYNLLAGIGEGLDRGGGALPRETPRAALARFYDEAVLAAAEDSTPERLRLAAIRLVGVSPYRYSDDGDWLLLLLGPRQSEALRSVVITTVVRYNDSDLPPQLLGAWASLTPKLRQQAMAELLGRNDRIATVLAALEAGKIPVTALTSAQAWFLRTWPDTEISTRAMRLLGPDNPRRPAAVEQFKPALRLTGLATRGHEIFVNKCAGCHERSGEGGAVGPELDSVADWSKDRMLESILEPNANLSPRYAARVAQASNGQNYVGLLRDENDLSITLRQANGEDVVLPRVSTRTERWSLMPEGLEAGLTPQGMADLLAYLTFGN